MKMKMLNFNRLIVVIIGVPLLVYAYLSVNTNAIAFLIFINLVIGFALYEFYSMLERSNRQVYKMYGFIVGLLIPNIEFLTWKTNIINSELFNAFNITIFSLFLLLIYRVISNKIEGSLESISLTFLGILYVSVFFSYLIKIAKILPDAGSILLGIQILVWACDTGAGLIGVSIGRKFFKRGFTEISPKKSIEGSIGGLLITAITMIILIFVKYGVDKYSLKQLIIAFIIAIFIGIVAEIGDLVESLFKRETKIKDSGNILLGHGGVLDRFDSMLLVLPFVYFLILFIVDKNYI